MRARVRSGEQRVRGTQVKANIMLVDYRGYGMSDGSPSQAGLLLDAQVCALVLCVARRIQRTA